MGRIVIHSAPLRLVIDPALGAGIARFDASRSGVTRPILRPAPDNPARFNDLACYTLAPWSNRIAHAAFTHNDRRVQLPTDWPDGSAIHGLVKNRPWDILDRSPISARLRLLTPSPTPPTPGTVPVVPAWPWAFETIIRYELNGPSMSAELTVTNLSAQPMPAGGGFHPYFMSHLFDSAERPLVKVPLTARYPAQNQIPTGPPHEDDLTRSLRAGCTPTPMDDVFLHAQPANAGGAGGDGGAEWARITWPVSNIHAVLRCSANMSHAVLYAPAERTPAAEWFCIEPVSMVNDGFNIHNRGLPNTGITTLSPGQSLILQMAITLEGL